MELSTLREFEVAVRDDIPDFKIAYKDQSSLHKAIGFLVYLFNPTYMTKFTTTIGSTVAFPSRAWYEKDPLSSFVILSHERIHMWDSKRHPLWFKFTYLFPQIMALVPILVFMVLAGIHAWFVLLPLGVYLLTCLLAQHSRILGFTILGVGLAACGWLGWALVGWKLLVLGATLLCLAPWPSPGRTYWEKRGYTMNIAISQWLGGLLTNDFRDFIVNHFITGQYFFMSWRKAPIERYVEQTWESARSGALQGTSPFGFSYDFLYRRNLLPH